MAGLAPGVVLCATVEVALTFAEDAGRGSKAICAVKVGELGGQPPLELLPDEEPFVELCRVTLLTPSISRSRASISATSRWLVAQPPTVKVGRLPGGVAEATALALAAPAAG
ncbi:MAG: hypothetical protein H0X28_13390, partial [Solirubrobacterales bacterium]|nr:hypothetical protein [Solirubrobacterales bacterium]